ncbi:MAG TPA: tRNA 2-methylthio-N6-isopentenyl adenosine(37) hydroxylase MiaE [Cytophagales bacterium]|nr:tRNA 2-methylthio-N6-isopentenyl adenosine(37) hydroxylase MiaE [Cytophagales bacterium]
MLGLELPTDPRWVDIAEKNIGEILTDHAYCEQKAASSCISLIIQFHEKEKLVEMLTPIVTEEWNHFARVINELKKRNLQLGAQRKDEYVEKLSRILKKGGDRTQQLVEKLLMNAMIEARSCERFRLLWKEIKDAELSQFYYELMVSEAGHYKNFLSLAKEYDDPQRVHLRWHEMLAQEAEIVKSLKARADRMH